MSATESLKRLITIICGLAITTAVVRVIAETSIDGVYGLRAPSMTSLLLFSVAILTIARFYHGNIRHLDEEYIGKSGKGFARPKRTKVPTRIAADFVVIFLEALLLSVMGYFVGSFPIFALLLATLLLFDAIWFFFFHNSDGPDNNRSKTWAANNLFFGIVFLAGSAWLLSDAVEPGHEAYWIAAFAVLSFVNIAIDVVQEFDLYFPNPEPIIKRIFVAAPFTAAIESKDAGIPHGPFRTHLSEFIRTLENQKYTVLSSHEREDWGAPDSLYSPEQALLADLEQLETADMLITLLTDYPSPGVQLEIGVALGRGIPVVQIRHGFGDGAVQVPYLNQAFGRPEIGREFNVVVVNSPPDRWAVEVDRAVDVFRRRNSYGRV
jgi:hypothetical protein